MKIEEYANTDNWFDYGWFYEKLVKDGYRKFAEVGVWKGHSISFLANLLRNEDSEIYAVDLFENTYKYSEDDSSRDPNLRKQIEIIYDVYNYNLNRTNTRHKIKDVKGISWEMSSKFEDNSLDVVFIDADHQYESVKKDITNWLPKVRKGGILSGHDYRPGNTVAKAVDEVLKDKNVIKGRGSVWYVEI